VSIAQLPIPGGTHNALLKAEEVGLGCVDVFDELHLPMDKWTAACQKEGLMKPDAPNRGTIGPLRYHAGLDKFTGTVTAGDARVDVTFDMNGETVSDALVRMGEAFLGELDSLRQAATNHVCQHMLDLKKGTWLRDSEAPLSEAQFKGRLKLIQAWLEVAGKRTLTFEDGGMFWGHDVMQDVNPDGSFADPYLYG
jgi:hypothetical protein